MALYENIGGLRKKADSSQQRLWERLTIIDDQIAERRQQLGKLLDLYLGDEFPKEVLTEREMRLEKTLASLIQERENFEKQLSGNEITDREHSP